MSYFFDSEMMDITPTRRVEGKAKVTGKAKYAAEYPIENLAHGVMVGSTIASGKILSINTTEAKAAPGVIDIITHTNKPKVPGFSTQTKIEKSRFVHPIFYTDRVLCNDQPIAMVLAETLEDAQYAASLVTAQYEELPLDINFKEEVAKVPLEQMGKERGNEAAWQNAQYIIDEEYTMATEVHNPMEMHATIAVWEADGKLTLYDKNQGVNSVQSAFSNVFEIPTENIHVISEFVGGGFGSGLRTWPHAIAAAMGAKQINRPVKVVLTRPQMFTMVGHRPESWQRVKLGADANGKLLGLLHQAKNASSDMLRFSDGITRVSRKIYGFENLKLEEALIPLNVPAPTWMRGPGDTTGCFAVESAIDELCYKTDIDPVEIRLKNLAPYEMASGLPWSTNYLNECLQQGAETIGWQNRNPKPNQQQEGDYKIGYGVAVGMWGANMRKTSASVEMDKQGIVTVRTAMTDIGTGTGTGMQNVAYDVLGIPKNNIKVALGDSDFPDAPSQGGSWGMASLSKAVVVASNSLKQQLAKYAWGKNLSDEEMLNVTLNEMGISKNNDNGSFTSYASIFENNNLETIKSEEETGPGAERKKYGFCSSAAHFYKVKVHAKTGNVIIDRMVIVVDAGKVINEKAAANQIIGAGVGGIGMALLEKQPIDKRNGRFVGNDFAGYHFATNADAPIIEVSFIGKPDPNINPSGAKGLGEVGIIGSAPAIANAIFNATGKRLRSLPIHAEMIV